MRGVAARICGLTRGAQAALALFAGLLAVELLAWALLLAGWFE